MNPFGIWIGKTRRGCPATASDNSLPWNVSWSLWFRINESSSKHSAGEIPQSDFSSRKKALTLFSDEIQAKIADQEKEEDALSSVTVNPEILVHAEKAEYYLSEGALTRDMVTDYVKEVKIYGADDYRITWKYPELFEEMRRKADGMETELNYNPGH